MKTEPSVCAILLTANRPEMAKRAVESFRRQTYANKRLLVWDSSATPPEVDYAGLPEDEYWMRDWNPLVIGQMRNKANQYACGGEGFEPVDVLIHWDDDDLSHPNRIAEQVQLLQSSGADAVGYNECLFWREQTAVGRAIGPGSVEWPDEAWLYTSTSQNEAIGSSLCYWRKTWERKPFQPTSQGEDAAFQIGLKVAAVHSGGIPLDQIPKGRISADNFYAPRLLCRIHSGNTSNAYTAENMRAAEWQRVPEWDDYCRAEFSR